MKRPYLEVTFRKGRPVAAYLYLPRPTGARATRTVEVKPGFLVDYADDGSPIGVELVDPSHAGADVVNEVLRAVGMPPIAVEDLSPLAA